MKSPLILILLSLGCTSALLDKPRNVAAVAGSQVMLYCKQSPTEPILLWQKATVASPTSFILISNGPKYTITAANPWSNVTINNAQQDDAGTYACYSPVGPEFAYAQVVILASAPTCTSNVTFTNLVSDAYVKTTCMVSFYSATRYAPKFTWSIASGSSLTATNQVTSSSVTSEYSEKILCNYNMRQLQVDVDFSTFAADFVPIQIRPKHATNTVAYAYKFTSPAMAVLCRISSVTIVNARPKYHINETMTCQADSQASGTISYVWTVNGMSLNGANLKLTPNLSLQKGSNSVKCTVTQTRNGQSFIKETTYTFHLASLVSDGSSPPRGMLFSIVGSLCVQLICAVLNMGLH